VLPEEHSPDGYFLMSPTVVLHSLSCILLLLVCNSYLNNFFLKWRQYQLVSALLASFQSASILSGRENQIISGVLKPKHLRKHSAFSFSAFLLCCRTLLFTPRRSLGVSGKLQRRRQTTVRTDRSSESIPLRHGRSSVHAAPLKLSAGSCCT
jgi:hypothetical protein